MVDTLVRASASPRASMARGGRLVARLLEVAGKLRVPGCVRSLFVSAAFRAFINLNMRKYTGAELDYVTLTRLLVTHAKQVRLFMQGDRGARLKPLIMDLVQAVPDSQLDTVLRTLEAQYGGLLVRPGAKSA